MNRAASHIASCARRLVTTLGSGLALFAATPLSAHEFWIEPGTFRTEAGTRVPLTLYVGQHFAGASLPYIPERFKKFFRAGPDGEHVLTGVLGDDPAGQFTATTPGRYRVALVTEPYAVTFDTGAEFEGYLRNEGLEFILPRHRERYRPGTKILESYYRCAKTLITVGAPGTAAPDRALGLPLELVAETLPDNTAHALQLRLHYLGQPLAGAQVLLLHKADPKQRLTPRTDSSGRVNLVLPRAGMWLASSVHMIPAPFYAKEQWRSIWTSLTFEAQ